MIEIKELTIKNLDESINLFIEVFTKEPWNDVYESRDQVVNYFNQFRENNYLKGFVLVKDEKVTGLSFLGGSPSLEGFDYFIHELCIGATFQGKK